MLASPDQGFPILLTGFEPFDGSPTNASWEAVQRLDGHQLRQGQQITAMCLPVVWRRAGAQVCAVLEHLEPGLVINVGQGRADAIVLEEHAHNANRLRRDNAGELPATTEIVPGGPARYTTALDTGRIVGALQRADIPAHCSEDAGGYLCNFVSYQCFHFLAQSGPRSAAVPTLFVHVPPLAGAPARPPTLPAWNVPTIVKALTIIVHTALEPQRHAPA